jgi:NACHT domain
MRDHAKRPAGLTAGRHPARRDGAIALTLFLLPTVVALALWRRHQLEIGTLTLLTTVALGLPVAWLAWAAYRDARRPATPEVEQTIAQVADQLAVAISDQWKAEDAVLALNDPYPLPVSWAAADPSLTDSWDSLVRLATSGAGWPAVPPAAGWAASPDGLAGKDRDLARVVTRVPTGRLIVLGEPGAGKTMLMVRLVLDLLDRRPVGGPVPILASVASWNPVRQDLRGWLAAKLMIDHTALAAAAPAGSMEPTKAGALLAAGLILPILDGLDEVSEDTRGPAISQINDALRPGEQLVLTCRTKDYRSAIRPRAAVEVTLRGAAAVELLPLAASSVRKYLQAAAGPGTKARWDPVLSMLGTNSPAGQVLTTPLMVGLASAIYNPRPGEPARTPRDPAELVSPSLTSSEVASLLLDAFIPAAYRRSLTGRWEAQDAEKWLVFLARHLEDTIAAPDLAWWQLPLAVSAFARKVPASVDRTREFIGYALQGQPRNKRGSSIDISSAASPMASLAEDRTDAIVSGPMLGLLIAAASVATFLALFGAAGAWIAVGAGIASTTRVFFHHAWPWYGMARIWLAVRRQLPWRLMGFLADAHQRGVLRQMGAIYQFRHIELQKRLVIGPSNTAASPDAGSSF